MSMLLNDKMDWEKEIVNEKLRESLHQVKAEGEKRLTLLTIWRGLWKERLTIMLFLCTSGSVATFFMGLSLWASMKDAEAQRAQLVKIRGEEIVMVKSIKAIADSSVLWHWEALAYRAYASGRQDTIKAAAKKILDNPSILKQNK
jgi:hypothetical protein